MELQMLRRLAVLAILTMTAIGCRLRETAPPASEGSRKEATAAASQPSKTPAAPAQEQASAKVRDPSQREVASAKPVGEESASDARENATSRGGPTRRTEAKQTAGPAATAAATGADARVVLLTPGGPLVMDVELVLDSKPQRESFATLIDAMLTAAAPDATQEPTWKNLAANEEYLKQQNEKTPVPARELKRWTEQYDTNRDGQIQRDEAAAWLGRATGKIMRAFSLRSSRTYFSASGASSRIWKLLDTDGDGELSAAELEHCAATLTAFDDDDDGAVTADEFETIYEQIQTDGGRTALDRSRTAFAAVHLAGDFPDSRLEYLLTDIYAPQQLLAPASFPELVKDYQPLDANQDGQLDRDEIAGMQTMKPQLTVSLNFVSAAGEKRADAPTLKFGEHGPELIEQPAATANHAIIALGETRLIFSADDLTSAAMPETAAEAAAIHLMVHDRCDPLFELLDANGDGRLGEREIATARQTLTQYDADHDGQLHGGELPYSMIVAFLRGEKADSDGFFRPQFRALPQSGPNIPSWFARADFNSDGDVSRREFLGTDAQFANLDKNGDGFVSPDEAAGKDVTRK